MSFKSGVKGRVSDRWWERSWWLWCGDTCMRRMRWIRRRVNTVVVAKLIYASSSWWGFTTVSDRQRLEGSLHRGFLQNLYSTDKPSITQIVEEADENFFNSITYNTSHLLHQLLPRRTESSYSLRSRPHNFELSHIHDDRNFIGRMLFYPYHNP